MSRSPSTALIATAAALAGALATHLAWLPLPLSLVLAAMLGLRLLAPRLRWNTSRLVWRLAVLALLGSIVWTTVGGFLGREAGSATLAAMLVAKLFESRNRRDYRVVVSVGLFLAMCGFLFDQGALQYLLGLAALLLALAALALIDAAPGVDAPGAARSAEVGAAFRDALRFVAVAMPFAAACFLFFPRLHAPLWGAPGDGFSARSGMSERMEPGQISSLALDDTPVMRVSFDGAVPPPAERYFRALVLWHFDGAAWHGHDAYQYVAAEPELEVEADATRYRYEVLLEPHDQRWLYLLDAPLALGDRGRLTGDLQGRWPERVGSVLRYSATSVTSYRMQPRLSPQQRALGFRYIGPRELNPRSQALARQWREETGGDGRAIAGRALALFNQQPFIYSLEPPLLARDSIDDFLFQTRAGFCEHYASAFTYLMRAAEVPARVVVGFQGGVLNRAGGYLTVRRSDAHAWSEIWLDGEGWVRIDPTAAVAPDRIQRDARAVFGQIAAWERQSWLAGLRDRFDVVGYWWRQRVVQFNARRQRDLLAGVGIEEARPSQLVLALLATAIASLVLGAALLARVRGGPRDPLLEAWRRLERRLARLGLARAAAEGPLEYGERVARARPELGAAVRGLTLRYVHLRYGRESGTRASIDAFERDVKRLVLPRARRGGGATIVRRPASSA